MPAQAFTPTGVFYTDTASTIYLSELVCLNTFTT